MVDDGFPTGEVDEHRVKASEDSFQPAVQPRPCLVVLAAIAFVSTGRCR